MPSLHSVWSPSLLTGRIPTTGRSSLPRASTRRNASCKLTAAKVYAGNLESCKPSLWMSFPSSDTGSSRQLCTQMTALKMGSTSIACRYWCFLAGSTVKIDAANPHLASCCTCSPSEQVPLQKPSDGTCDHAVASSFNRQPRLNLAPGNAPYEAAD